MRLSSSVNVTVGQLVRFEVRCPCILMKDSSHGSIWMRSFVSMQNKFVKHFSDKLISTDNLQA